MRSSRRTMRIHTRIHTIRFEFPRFFDSIRPTLRLGFRIDSRATSTSSNTIEQPRNTFDAPGGFYPATHDDHNATPPTELEVYINLI